MLQCIKKKIRLSFSSRSSTPVSHKHLSIHQSQERVRSLSTSSGRGHLSQTSSFQGVSWSRGKTAGSKSWQPHCSQAVEPPHGLSMPLKINSFMRKMRCELARFSYSTTCTHFKTSCGTQLYTAFVDLKIYLKIIFKHLIQNINVLNKKAVALT